MPDEESISGATVSASGPTPEKDGSKSSVDDTSKRQGYQRLADLMELYPAAGIFRQFGSLNALNLLYYQAELSVLETHLATIAKEDRESPDRLRRLYFQSYCHLSQRLQEGDSLNPEDNVQWTIVQRIREVLKQYNEALLLQSKVRYLPRPAQGSLDHLRQWLSDNGNGDFINLLGEDNDIYWQTQMQDLVALYAREYEDFISTWITEKALFWYNKVLGHRFQKDRYSGTFLASTSVYSRKPVLRLVTGLAICIASLVPIMSVVLLNLVQGTNTRLGLMALFTVIFCGLFGLFTGARKTELLAASAGFAAVQVVFVSGNECCNN